MNGLKYVRTRCNLSLNTLADTMGITRQALSMWETGKKEIPEQRKEQLAQFFGINKAYFGEITEAEKKVLLEKAMFRYEDKGQETYRYKPKEDLQSLKNIPICFLPDEELSLDERYNLAQKRKKELLEEIDNLIQWTDDAGGIESQMVCMNRGCTVFGIVAEFMKYMREQDRHIKMPFYYSMLDVLKAMQLSYGMLEDTSLMYKNPDEEWYCGEDGEWSVFLAKEIKSHWNDIYQFHQKQRERVLEERTKRREEAKKTKTIMEDQGVEKTIQKVEKDYKELLKKQKDEKFEGTVTTFVK